MRQNRKRSRRHTKTTSPMSSLTQSRKVILYFYSRRNRNKILRLTHNTTPLLMYKDTRLKHCVMVEEKQETPKCGRRSNYSQRQTTTTSGSPEGSYKRMKPVTKNLSSTVIRVQSMNLHWYPTTTAHLPQEMKINILTTQLQEHHPSQSSNKTLHREDQQDRANHQNALKIMLDNILDIVDRDYSLQPWTCRLLSESFTLCIEST